MNRGLTRVIGCGAILAPAMHLASDLLELANDGFTRPQLWINYVAFLAMPFVLVGVYSTQAARAHWLTLTGALLYGASFVYFAHTALLSLEAGIGNYASMWSILGATYTVHGALMIAGGSLFALFSYRAGGISRTGLSLFAAGLIVNVIVAGLLLPEDLQICGSTLRNLGLIVIGFSLLATTPHVPRAS